MNNNGRVRGRVKDPNVLSVPAPPPGSSMGGSSEDDDCPLEVEGPLLPVAEEPKEAGVPFGAPTFWMLSGRLHRCVKLPTWVRVWVRVRVRVGLGLRMHKRYGRLHR